MTEENLYDGRKRSEWFEELNPHNDWMRRHLFSLWSVMGTPGKHLDVGCGTGNLVFTSRLLGIDSYGVDQLVFDGNGSPYNPDWFFHADLKEPFSLGVAANAFTVHWVTCFEVAEHIPEDYHPVLCDTLASHVVKDGVLFFSAAHPGQGGTKHLEARPAKYWHDRFHERGLNFNRELTARVITAWGQIDSPLYWLLSNLQIFER